MTWKVPADADVVIVGSGPAGAAFARRILDSSDSLRVVVVEAGPALTSAPGKNVRQLPEADRGPLQRLAEGPLQRPTESRSVVARPGTFLVNDAPDGGDLQTGMPAAAMSSNVGGMAAHWTCACPRPADSEVPTFLDPATFETALTTAEDYLHVTQEAFTPSEASDFVLTRLREHFSGRHRSRPPQPMPLAATPRAGGLPLWAGVAEVLGEWPDRGRDGRFTLASETLAVELVHAGDRISGVRVRSMATGEERVIAARAVVVAADAFRTPQLLWASNIRPPALGRYLNDQPQIVCAVTLDELASNPASAGLSGTDQRDALTGVMWVPFADPEHPFHGQVMQMDASPIRMAGADLPTDAPLIGLGWFATKQPRPEDRVTFSETERDAYDMPAISIDYELTDEDRTAISRATDALTGVAKQLGTVVLDGPKLLPAGSSLHYQGTVRMGPHNDGTSVCDPHSRVWDIANLYVAGNGVIPTPTACNPTLTSVALAVLGADHLVSRLGATT